MHKTIISLVAVLIALIHQSCSNQTNEKEQGSLMSKFIGITKNEDKGVKEIINLYGGVCKYSVGVSVSSNSNKSKYFELELSKIKDLDTSSKNLEMMSSNIAYLFFSNLKDEKANYNAIHTILVLDHGRKIEHIYTNYQLEIMESKMKVVNQALELIKRKDFGSLAQLLSPKTFNTQNQIEFTKKIETTESSLGAIISFQLLGFRFYNMNDGMNIMHISVIINRDNENTQFGIDIDNKASEDKILHLDYNF